MLRDALFAYWHYLSFAATAIFLAWEILEARRPIDAARAQRLAVIDLGYFAAVLSLIGSGLVRLFYGAKPVAFYLENPAFHAKMGVLIAVALCSLPPTLAFQRWRSAAARNPESHPEPFALRRVRRFLTAQAILIPCIPLFAVLMARGIGMR